MFKGASYFPRFPEILAKSLSALILVLTLLIYIFADILSDQNPVKAIGGEITASRQSRAANTAGEVSNQICASCHFDNGALIEDLRFIKPSRKKLCIECHPDTSSPS